LTFVQLILFIFRKLLEIRAFPLSHHFRIYSSHLRLKTRIIRQLILNVVKVVGWYILLLPIQVSILIKVLFKGSLRWESSLIVSLIWRISKIVLVRSCRNISWRLRIILITIDVWSSEWLVHRISSLIIIFLSEWDFRILAWINSVWIWRDI